jgi:hypothetical protein
MSFLYWTSIVFTLGVFTRFQTIMFNILVIKQFVHNMLWSNVIPTVYIKI